MTPSEYWTHVQDHPILTILCLVLGYGLGGRLQRYWKARKRS